MSQNSGEIQESQSDKITRLAKEALNSDDVDATRAFLMEVNRTSDRMDVSEQIVANQTGLIDGIAHAFSDNPTFSWKMGVHPMGDWAKEMTFKLGDKEIYWNLNSARNVSEMSDAQVAKFEIDYAEERRIAQEERKMFLQRERDAVVEVGELSDLAEVVLKNPDSEPAKQALITALNKTEPLKTSMAIEKFESSWKGRSEPDIDISWGAHPMGNWINNINFRGFDREITWKPGDKNIEVKEAVDI